VRFFFNWFFVNSAGEELRRKSEEWGEVFWDPFFATVNIDRIIHHCRIIVIKAESYRMQNYKQKRQN